MTRALVYLLTCCSLAAQVIIHGPTATPITIGSGADPLLPYLVNQNFEGTGYDNSETWTETGTGIDEDYATSPAPLLGSQSCRIVSTGGADTRTVKTFTAQSTLYAHVLWHRVSNPGTEDIISFRSTGSARLTIRITTGGAITVVHGSATATVTDTVATGSTIHIWAKYVQGTGSDGVAEVGYSTDTTRPTSGTKFASLSNGTATTTVDRIYLGDAGGTFEWIFDECFVDEAGYPQP